MTRDAPAVYAVLAFLGGMVSFFCPILSMCALLVVAPDVGVPLFLIFAGGMVVFSLFIWLDAMKGPHG